MSMTTREERSVVSTSKDAATGTAAGAADQDISALLLDGKLGEILQSIRALARSNDELREALKEHPGDRDFIVAIHENEEIIVKRREAAAELVRRLRKAGIDADVPQDVLEMKMEWKGCHTTSSGSGDGDVAKEGGAADEVEVEKDETTPTASTDEGLYL